MFDLETYQQHLTEAAERIAAVCGPLPPIGIIAGTGLGNFASLMEPGINLPYAEIPHFPTATVQSHRGALLRGRLEGQEVTLLQGRVHLYEGYAPWEIALPIRALARCGMQTLVVTNAAGGLDLTFHTGDIMLITDHLNMMGCNALSGPHCSAWGDRFPDMSSAYDANLQRLALDAAADLGIDLRQGVYVGVRGPCLETPAETRFYRLAGGDAIGMSTVQEVIAARQAGMRVLGFSVITNINDPERMAPATVEEIVAAAAAAAPRLTRLVARVVTHCPQQD